MSRRFQMREKLLSIGDDSWIEDESGDHVYKVDGKAMRIRDTFILEDRDGREVAKIQERKLRVRDSMKIERDGETVATVHKALVGFRDRFRVSFEDGEELRAHGNILDHEYEIRRDDTVIARDLQEWFRVRDTYGIEIGDGEDEPLMLALIGRAGRHGRRLSRRGSTAHLGWVPSAHGHDGGVLKMSDMSTSLNKFAGDRDRGGVHAPEPPVAEGGTVRDDGDGAQRRDGRLSGRRELQAQGRRRRADDQEGRDRRGPAADGVQRLGSRCSWPTTRCSST